MLIIMLLEVAAIICGYIFYNKIEDRIKEMLNTESLIVMVFTLIVLTSHVTLLSRFTRTHRKALLRIQCTATTKQMIHGPNSGIIYNYKENVVGKFSFSTAPNYERMKFTVHSKYVPN